MAITTFGRDLIALAVIAGTYTPLNNANAHLGVGDSTTAFSAAHTDLQAATNKIRKAMDATFPTNPPSPANVLTFRATFATTEANWVWNEWGLFNASSGANMFSRKVESLGTKTSASAWQFTVTMTITV